LSISVTSSCYDMDSGMCTGRRQQFMYRLAGSSNK